MQVSIFEISSKYSGVLNYTCKYMVNYGSSIESLQLLR